MKWNGRSVFLLIAFSMIVSSMFTLMLVKGNNGSLNTSNAVATASRFFSMGGGTDEYPKDFARLVTAYNIIKQQYIEEVSDEQLVKGAIQGMIGSLEDPYSDYMDPVTAEEFKNTLHSSFQGIGAEVSMQNGQVTIVSAFKDSPAERAGLRPLDQILSVNGESLEGLSLQEAVSKIRGPKGTKATLKVVRPGIAEPLTIVVIRDEIPIETVSSEVIHNHDGKFGKIQIKQFSSDTAKEFKDALDKLESEKIEGLVIDVRGNPGGFLTAVKHIGEFLIPDQKPIVRIEYGHPPKQAEEYHSAATEAKPYPIVILIDKGSASASEILAAAMKESGGYTLVGETTFGKGTVQNTLEMEDKSQLKLTIAKWLTPNGNWVHKTGVEPDIVVSQPEYFNAMQLPHDKELSRDMNGVEVANLQIILDGLGYSPGRKDGYFDDKTEAQVKKFQQKYNLNATGVVDNATARKLEEVLIEAIRDPKNDRQLQKALETLAKQAKGK